jgi:tetratricopeptide (TPR) repeat protein
LARFDEAQEAAEKISPGEQANASRTLARKARALEALAAALEDAGEHERAVAAANAALGAARNAAGDATGLYAFGSEALNIAAKALARVGDNRRAQATSRAALDLTRAKLEGGA